MTLSLKTVSYTRQVEAASKAAQLAISKPKEVLSLSSTACVRPVGPHVLQEKIEAEYSGSAIGLKNREKLVQTIGVLIVALSTWVIGYSLYARF